MADIKISEMIYTWRNLYKSRP